MSTDLSTNEPMSLLEALESLPQHPYAAHWPEDREVFGFKLVCTCGACPEQYDVFDAGGQQVGYLRLRHGCFSAEYPECGGDEVFYSEASDGDGQFDANERDGFLKVAVERLWQRHRELLACYTAASCLTEPTP